MKYINLSEFQVGRKQQAGVMSVYPLFAEDVKTPLAKFEDIKFHGTSGYGTMVFTNQSEHPFILPTGYAIITKQLAQDHALPFASLLAPESKRHIHEACCIQQTQGGYIDGSKVKSFFILPLYIRKKHFEQTVFPRGKNPLWKSPIDFARLWKHISDFQSKLVKRNEGNLVLFFNKFMEQLTQFNAEFEVLDGQRGAVVLLNDKIVGIEVAPTHEYWKTVWNSLIRDCYGSEVIRLTMQNLIEEFQASQELAVDFSGCDSIEAIESAIEKHYQKGIQDLKERLEDIGRLETIEVDGSKDVIRNNSFGNIAYHIVKAKDADIYGEVYCDKDSMIYCSLLF